MIAGTAYGVEAPTTILSPTLYVHARLSTGATLAIDETHPERAIYIASGRIGLGSSRFSEGSLLVLPRAPVSIHCTEAADVMLLGGAALDGDRHIDWNFVSSSLARLDQAKADWRAGRFPKVPGDEHEFIPLPEA